MSDRHPKWTPVEPGTVIPAGQPYRVEFNQASDFADVKVTEKASESERNAPLPVPPDDGLRWFVDSSWKPPLVLPTHPGSVIRASFDDPKIAFDLALTYQRYWIALGGSPHHVGKRYDSSTLTLWEVLFDAGAAR